MPLHPIDLVIRFGGSDAPDILLPIPDPDTTTGMTLNQLLRAHLPPPSSTSHTVWPLPSSHCRHVGTR